MDLVTETFLWLVVRTIVNNMLDVTTLRLALGVVSVVVLGLFYLAVFRPTRSPFAMWWSIALLSTSASSLLFLLNGSVVQGIANPLGSIVSVIGAVSVWFATRRLRGLRPLPVVLWSACGAVGIVALLEDPAHNVWAGNGLLLWVMAVAFCLAAWDLWQAWRARRGVFDSLHDGEARMALLVASLAASLLAVFYVLRWALFAFTGQGSDIFHTLAGTGSTTLVLLVSLVAVTFSVASLGYDEQTQELRRRIARDELTGLLSRAAFLEGAQKILKQGSNQDGGTALVIADLDYFKRINDTYGHATGDGVLEAFGTAVEESVTHGEIAGRLGGEEFGIVLRHGTRAEITERLEAVSERFTLLCDERGVPLSTVSYGATFMRRDLTLSQLLGRADEAMYSAKENGRDQVVVDVYDD